MQRNVTQSAELMRFISGVAIDPKGDLILNVLDKENSYFSKYYTPRFKVSRLSAIIKDEITTGNIEKSDKKLGKKTLTKMIIDSDLQYRHPTVYRLAKTIVLECFSVIYAIQEDPDMLAKIEQKDLYIVLENIKYVIDSLGASDDYVDIVGKLHSTSVAVGYILHQLPLMKGDSDL